MDETIKKRLDRIDAKLNALYELLANRQIKPAWVGPKKFGEATGIKGWQLYDARQRGSIVYRRTKNGGYEYDLASLDDKLITQSSEKGDCNSIY